jgi:hypothetical protein
MGRCHFPYTLTSIL